MWDAVSADQKGMAQVLDENGHEVASIRGPGHWLSARKANKARSGSKVMIYTPPRVPGRFTQIGLVVEYKRLGEFTAAKRSWLETLDWQPCDPVSVIDKLGGLV